MRNILDKLNINSINSAISLLLKILKISYILIIILAAYVFILLCREFNIFKIIFVILKLLFPFFMGFVMAYLLNPIVKKFEKRLNRKLVVTIIYLLILVLISLFCIYLYPKMQKEILDLMENVPVIIDETNLVLNNFIHKISYSSEHTINVRDVLNNYFNNFNIKNINAIICILKNAFSIIGIIVLSLIISFYLLLDFDKIINYIKCFFKVRKKEKIIRLLLEIDEKVFLFIKGTLLITLIVLVASIIGFSITGLKEPIFFGLYNAVTNIIPYIGPYIGGIPIVIVAFTSSNQIGISTLIVVIIVQIIESYALQPIIMGKSMSLHPVTILISLLLFGYFFGIIGMVIAMPIISIIKTIIIFMLRENYDE